MENHGGVRRSARALGVLVVVLLAGCSSASSGGASTTVPAPTPTTITTTSIGPTTTTLPAVPASTGCGEAPAIDGLTKDGPGDVALTFESGGVQRSYRLAVPDDYDQDTPAPLILNLHGSGSNAVQQSIYSDLPRQAAARGMLTITPDAIAANWQLGATGTDDDFLVALVRSVEDQYCIDLDQVDVAGLSLGSWKAAVMVCVHPDTFAAAGLVAVEVHPNVCPAKPVIAFHGTADHVVPYGEGADPGVVVTGFNADLPGAHQNMAAWAKAAGCEAQQDVNKIGSDVELWTYPGCDAGVDVQLYTVVHGDHTWPGSKITIGPTTHTIDATKLILDFFEAHRMT